MDQRPRARVAATSETTTVSTPAVAQVAQELDLAVGRRALRGERRAPGSRAGRARSGRAGSPPRSRDRRRPAPSSLSLSAHSRAVAYSKPRPTTTHRSIEPGAAASSPASALDVRLHGERGGHRRRGRRRAPPTPPGPGRAPATAGRSRAATSCTSSSRRRRAPARRRGRGRGRRRRASGLDGVVRDRERRRALPGAPPRRPRRCPATRPTG